MIDDKQAHDARARLFEFIEELHNFLQKTVNEPYDREGKLLVLEEMMPELREAWLHFDEDFNWDKAKDAVFEAPANHLETHGLYGAQLRAKLSLVRIRVRSFFDGITKNGLLKVVDAYDTLLDSIIAATGLDGAIKEMKDLLRNSVDD